LQSAAVGEKISVGRWAKDSSSRILSSILSTHGVSPKHKTSIEGIFMASAKRPSDKPRGNRSQGPAPAHRFRIRWKHGQGEIVKHIRIDRMTLPPPVWDRPEAPLLGHHAELHDARATVLYRVHLPDLTDNTVELFERDGRMTRAEKRAHARLVDVLVPEIPEASRLVICHYARQATRERQPTILQEFSVAEAMQVQKEAPDGTR
jgi:hypothetical protein